MPKILIFVFLTFFAGTILPFIYGAHWAFYLYELIYFLNPEHRWWGHFIPDLPYSKISVIILFLVFVIKYNDYKQNTLVRLPLFKWFVFIFLSLLIAYFYALNPEVHQYFLIQYIKLLVIIALAYKVLNTQQKLNWALFAYILGCFYIGYEAYSVGRNSGGRVEGIGLLDAPDSNGVAAAIAPVFPFLIFYFWQGNKYLKTFVAIAGVFILNAIILINSRGAFLGIAVGTSYFLWKMYTSKVKLHFQKQQVLLIVLLAILAILYLSDEGFIERIQTLSDLEDEEKSGSHRYRMWLATFDLMRDYPFGTGVSGYNILSPIYVEPHLFVPGQTQKSVHSMWFQALSEIGWHGFFFFLMLIYSAYNMCKSAILKSLDDNNSYQYFFGYALLSSYISFLVAGSFINQFRVQMLYWLILFIACFYTIIHNNQKIIRK